MVLLLVRLTGSTVGVLVMIDVTGMSGVSESRMMGASFVLVACGCLSMASLRFNVGTVGVTCGCLSIASLGFNVGTVGVQVVECETEVSGVSGN